MAKNFMELKIKTRFIYTEKGGDKRSKMEASLSDFEKAVLHYIDKNTFGEYVYTYAGFYNKIFGKKVSESTSEKRLIKITNPKNKKSVWRIWTSISTDIAGAGIETKDIIYMDKEAKQILTGSQQDSEEETPVKLQFRKVGLFSYYLHCGDKFNKLSFQIAAVSLLLGIVSLVIAFVG